ncbi:hypothetical protein ABZS66_50770 [Dactylosporangium sp. NPDC005572]|uniref:hypothetical protein n=1 Tax=Dactylosporangium sp. NPDC005572 TaxID=3156889 RepID=UPI00339DE846
MTEIHPRIAELRRRAYEAVEQLGGVPDGPPHRRRALHEARELANRCSAFVHRSPSAALAGQVSAGKSLLASLLTGVPDLLPVSNTPTTGNVTRLRLHAVPPGSAARRGTIAVGFLTPQETARLAEAIVARITDPEEGTPHPALAALRGWSPVDVAAPERSDWSRLDVLRPLWTDDAADPTVRDLAFELVQLRNALDAGAGFLARVPGAGAMAIDAALLRDAVKIGTQRVPGAAFPERVHRPPFPADRLTAEALTVVFPLVDEIVIDVDVPRDVLDTGGVPTDLLDLPGLNSGNERDRWVVRRKLPETSTVVMVLDGRVPGASDAAARFFGMLQQGRYARKELADSLLVLVNRLELLRPPPGAYPVRSIGELAARSEDFAVLDGLLDGLTNHRQERAALVSALRAVLDLGWPTPPSVAGAEVRAADEYPDAWRSTVDALLAGSAPEPMAVALADWTGRDGGLDAARRLVGGHLQRHGLRIWLAEAEAMLADLDARCAELAPEPAPGAVRPDVVRRLRAVSTALTRAVHELSRQVQQVPLLAILPDGDGQRIDRDLRERATVAVHGWDVWTNTLVYAPDGLVEIGVLNVGELADLGIVTALDDLREHYEGSYAELLEAADRQLDRIVDGWAGRVWDARPVASAIDLLRADAGLLEPLLGGPVDGPGSPSRWRVLEQFTDRSLVRQALAAVRTAADAGADAGAVPAAPFPAYPLDERRALPWHPRLPGPPDGPARDSVHVLRLRRDVVNAIDVDVRRRVQAALGELRTELSRRIPDLLKAIPKAGEIPRLAARHRPDDPNGATR